MERIETVVLSALLTRRPFLNKVIPFLDPEYFLDPVEKRLFEHIVKHVEAYSEPPTPAMLRVDIQSDETLGEKEFDQIVQILDDLPDVTDTNEKWLFDKTEEFCSQRAIFNAISTSVQIIDGNHKTLSPHAIPELLEKALSVSFNTDIGHDYFEEADKRYDYYHSEEEKCPFDIDILNRVTRGGAERKTLNIIMAPTGVGKSIFLCHRAADAVSQGKNVLYITMEMSEERIAERIDANLLEIETENLPGLKREDFVSRVQALQRKSYGKLIIKQYPTGGAHVGHFRALLNELRMKKGFVPDTIVIDYLNICASSRMKYSGSVNTYMMVKAIAEEVRGLGVEFNAEVWSATQTNRDGFDSTDVDLTNVSESIGLPQTADFMFALIQTDDMEELGQALFKILKNRYAKKSGLKSFMVGLNKDRMKFFDLENPTDGILPRATMNTNTPSKDQTKKVTKAMNQPIVF